MKVVRSIANMQAIRSQFKARKKVALVPTMGFLHQGHLSLIELAYKKADIVIVSLFVNPTQFGPHEDLSSYPRDLKGDLKKLKDMDVDFVFVPQSKHLYKQNHQTKIHLSELSQSLCGAHRPGHFDGVATIVTKLFMITQPHVAVFGKKDYQQWLIIKQLVSDLDFPIKILGAPIVRERDGLAMSSRNSYLSESEREHALSLYRGLKKVKRACQSQALSVSKMKALFKRQLPAHKSVNIQYVECLNAKDLTVLNHYVKGETLLAVAVKVGKTRLIDNMVF